MVNDNNPRRALRHLENDTVHVWHAVLDHHGERYAIFHQWLSGEETVRAQRFKPPQHRRFVLTRGLLRQLLSDYTGLVPHDINFSHTPLGKLLHRDPPLHSPIEFSLSHSGNQVAFAFTLNTPLGIDIECKKPRRHMKQIAYRFLSSDDYERIQCSPMQAKQDAFFDAWVYNEALIKARGHRLMTHPLSQYKALNGQASSPLCEEEQQYTLSALTLHRNIAAALAVQGPAKSVRVRQYKAL